MAGEEQINLEKLAILEPKMLRKTPCCLKVSWATNEATGSLLLQCTPLAVHYCDI